MGWETAGKSVSSLGYTLLAVEKQGSKGLLGYIEPCTCNSELTVSERGARQQNRQTH